MSCEPQFVSQLDWVCLKAVIDDVRGAKVSVATVQKALWVVGCAVSSFAPANPVIGAESAEADRSIESLCDELESRIPAEGAFGDDPAKIDPATVIMIVQLIWKLIQTFKK